MKIPSNKQYTQFNEGEMSGVLYESYNMAFNTLGQAKLARRPVALMSSATDAQFAYPLAIVYFSGAYKIITSDELFEGSITGTSFLQTATFSPNTTLGSDALVFNSLLHVTTDTNLDTWNGGGSINTARLGVALTSGVPHPLCIFDSNPTFKLAVGNGNSVKLYDTSYNLSATVLTLPAHFQVTTLRYRNGFLYVGTRNTVGGEARIFSWNGAGTDAQYECPVGAEWVFSMTEYGSSVAAITSQGQLVQISGSQYVQLAAFPVYYLPHTRWQGAGGLQLNGKVFNRGMTTVGESIYLNVEGETDTGYIPEMKSGLWVFDPDIGLYHRATSTTDTLVRDTTLSVTNSIITTSAVHKLLTGDAVQFTGVLGLAGIATQVPYYVTVLSTTTFKLSTTREGLAESRFVEITGTAVASDALSYYPNSNRGRSLSVTSGAIALTTYQETPLDMLSTEVIWGARSDNEAGTATYVLCGFHDSNNTGSITTQRIISENIAQNWNELHTFLDGVVTENDTAVIKVSNKKAPNPIKLTGAWATARILNSSSLYSAWGDIEVGDELVFVSGYGQGRTAHVTEISTSSSTYSLTLDESLGTIGGTARFYRTNFKKIGKYGTAERDFEFIKTQLLETKPSPWLKIKCELRGTDMSLNYFDLTNIKNK